MNDLQTEMMTLLSGNDIPGVIDAANKTTGKDKAEILSLAYRLMDDYDHEKEIVQQGIQQNPQSSYFIDRAKWHEAPLASNLVGRRPLHFDKDPDWTPKPETLDQLCFVTIGGGDRVFDDMVESLESLRNTPSYGNHPVKVVDTGLSVDQKHYLSTTLGVLEFYDPANMFPGWAQKQQSWISIAYFPTFFKGHRYYFHMECDTWVQDERSIDHVVKLCEQQGWALDGWNIGIYCIDTQSGFDNKWQGVTEKNPLITELSGNRLYQRHGLRYLKDVDETACPEYMFQHTKPGGGLGLTNDNLVWHTGMPLKDKEGVLVDSVRLQPVGFFHYHKPCTYLRGRNYKLLTVAADNPLNATEWKEHIARSRQQLAGEKEPVADDDNRYNASISLRYRTFPWKDKLVLENQLKERIGNQIADPITLNPEKKMGIEKYLPLIKTVRCIIPVKQRIVIGEQILSKGPGCNLLVFGLGGDSVIWNTINENGYSLFIEHDERWANTIAKQVPGINVRTYQYPTKCDPVLPIEEQPPIDLRNLVHHQMPVELVEKKWDVILIDGPTGFDSTCPGRSLPIYWSSLIADKHCDIFVDDYSRPIEFTHTNKFLFPKYNRFHLFEERLKLLWLKGE